MSKEKKGDYNSNVDHLLDDSDSDDDTEFIQ